MSHRNRDASRALAMRCGFSAAGGLVQAQHAPAVTAALGRRYSLSVTYDFGSLQGLPPRC